MAGDFDYEWQNQTLGLGRWWRPFEDKTTWSDYVLIMPRIMLHTDGGRVLDAGDKPTIKAGQDYVRMGPLLSLTFVPGNALPLPDAIILKTKLQFFYGHYAGLEGRAYTDYGANLHWILDSKGIFGLDTTYEHGGLNANGDKADQVTVGFTILQ